MESKIITKPAFVVVGLKYHGNNENNEIPALWRAFGTRFKEVKNIINPGIAYGIADNYDEACGVFDYIAGVEVESDVEIPEGMICWEVPESTYAVFTCTLPTLSETYEQIDKTWLPQSGYQRINEPEFELYDEEFNPEDPTSKMEIYIPIEKKE